jgi:quercetin dioxygenase-like cupin family protein
MDYQYIADLAGEVTIPQNGILSRTLHNDERLKAVLFGFDAGQELSEHTAAVPAVLHILQGEARLRLGEDHMDAKAGGWVHMPPQLPHGVYAKTPVLMLLLMLKSPA